MQDNCLQVNSFINQNIFMQTYSLMFVRAQCFRMESMLSFINEAQEVQGSTDSTFPQKHRIYFLPSALPETKGHLDVYKKSLNYLSRAGAAYVTLFIMFT